MMQRTLLSAFGLVFGLNGCVEPGNADQDVSPATEGAEADAGSSTAGGTTDDATTVLDGTTTGHPQTSTEGTTGDDTTATTGDGTTGDDTTGDDTTGDDTTGSTGERVLEDDGDHQANPGVLVQFRPTAGAPISLDGPIFNDDALDVRGFQYLGQVSSDGDPEDWVEFSLVGGDTPTSFQFALECAPDPDAQLRAEILDSEGSMVDVLLCGQDQGGVALDSDGLGDPFFARIYPVEGTPGVHDYTLSIHGYCAQNCEFAPYTG